MVELLCIPQAIEKQFLVHIDVDLTTAREIQSSANLILCNLAMLSGKPSARACQQNDCLDILMSMIDLPENQDLSRNVALTLLHFVDEPTNIPYIENCLEKIILLVIREGPSCRILLKLLAKLYPHENDDEMMDDTSNKPPPPLPFPQPMNVEDPNNNNIDMTQENTTDNK